MKKVSIVLPVYNGEEHLAEAITSVLSQTYENMELIIVDDCSTDGTPQIISNFVEKDNRVKAIRNKVNQKLPRSLNIGFGLAEGELLTWTSDDNRYKEDAVEKMSDYLEHHPEIGMVYCDYTIIDENGIEREKKCLDEPERLLWGNTVGACFLYTKEVAQKVGSYDSEMFLAEDYDYWIRIYKEGPIVHLPENLYYYRRHSKSLTTTRLEEIKHQTVVLWMKHWEFIFLRLRGSKEKRWFCNMILEVENDVYKKDTYKRIIRRYPVYYCYRKIKAVYHWVKAKEKH
ncbi:MAG: glycosyltransferase [Lachnospiraceae bacterium]|nr:glycosyltransferase [Lachnospiraceae bacterium]